LAYLIGQTGCGKLDDMDDLEKAAAEHRRAKAALAAVRPRLAAAIYDAAVAKRPQVDIVRITGYTRERIRQICRDEEKRGAQG
jgi:acetate kinase